MPTVKQKTLQIATRLGMGLCDKNMFDTMSFLLFEKGLF